MVEELTFLRTVPSILNQPSKRQLSIHEDVGIDEDEDSIPVVPGPPHQSPAPSSQQDMTANEDEAKSFE